MTVNTRSKRPRVFEAPTKLTRRKGGGKHTTMSLGYGRMKHFGYQELTEEIQKVKKGAAACNSLGHWDKGQRGTRTQEVEKKALFIDESLNFFCVLQKS